MNFNVDPNSGIPKTTGGFSLSIPAATSAVNTATTQGFSFTSGNASTANKLAPSMSPVIGIGLQPQAKPTAAVPAVSISLGFSSSGFSLDFKPDTSSAVTSSMPVTSVGTSASLTLATTNVVASTPAGTSSSLNFCQLEEGINKWTLELEEQEKIFMNQATQVNAWDRLLIANGEKIVGLNSSVERVKLEQQQLDHELDFILAQQRELEDCLVPLEKELDSSGLQDPEREHTYMMAENMDTQLKQMSEDLKEIIEHLNEANQSQDTNDPIVQIGRILNAHMNSLQWIDQNSSLISSHLDQVAKLNDVYRRETQRSFHLTYE